MMSSVIPARLDFQCGHAALVSLPRVKGESSVQRNLRIATEKSGAQSRACDFCAPRLEVVVPQLMADPIEEVEEIAAIEEIEAIEELAAIEVVEVADVVEPVDEPEAVITITPLPEHPVVPVAPIAAAAPRRTRRTSPTRRAPRARRELPVTVEQPSMAVEQPASTAHVATQRYQVQFQVETVLAAADIREALRLAAALGATDVVAITLEA